MARCRAPPRAKLEGRTEPLSAPFDISHLVASAFAWGKGEFAPARAITPLLAATSRTHFGSVWTKDLSANASSSHPAFSSYVREVNLPSAFGGEAVQTTWRCSYVAK